MFRYPYCGQNETTVTTRISANHDDNHADIQEMEVGLVGVEGRDQPFGRVTVEIGQVVEVRGVPMKDRK